MSRGKLDFPSEGGMLIFRGGRMSKESWTFVLWEECRTLGRRGKLESPSVGEMLGHSRD